MAELIYPELSYKLVGVLFKVYHKLGGGYQERIYQAAVKRELAKNKIGFKEQVGVDLLYDGDRLYKYRLDFIIEQRIVLELKVGPKFTPRDIMQVLCYLKQSGLQLGLLVSFNRRDIFFKRILKGKK